MEQISIYRNTQKFANVPVPKAGAVFMQNVTQVPSMVMAMIRNYARGSEPRQTYGEWAWEWQQRGTAIVL